MKIAIWVVCGNTGPTPHDGKWIMAWNPHTRAGILEASSTANPERALTWPDVESAMTEWNTVSKIETRRPWDQRPNKPLTGLTIEVIDLDTLPK